MAKFVFHLEAVRRHRELVEEIRQRELADLEHQKARLEEELRGVQHEVHDATGELRGGRLSGVLDMRYIAAHRRYVLAMQRKAVAIVQRMASLQKQIDAARLRLAEAAKQLKIVEKLRERRHQRWLADHSRREAMELDEIGMQLAHRAAAEEARI